jgi:uracil-DNA glycosylase
MYDIFNALKATSCSHAKVVILGQDPYHGPGQAHGMCFSVKPGVPKPPSLVNVFKELQADLGVDPPTDGHLIQWARQGVLMLNTVLTVREGSPNSHKGKGWEIFTDQVIRCLDERERPLVFFLWGANARAKKALITHPAHLILEAAHPSPLSAYNGFIGCRHFSKANAFLEGQGSEGVDWKI